MALKKGDYNLKKGTQKDQLERPVQINDKSMNLTVDYTLNHKKGLYDISLKWNFQAITEDDALDKATVKMLGELMFEARNKCIEWRKDWLKNQPDED